MTSKSSITIERNDNDRMPPLHPGEFLSEEFLKPLGVSQYRLAQATGMTPIRVSEIVRGRRGVTPETAIRLAKALGTTPEFWLKLQAYHDLEVARDHMGDATFAAIEKVA